MMYLHKTLPIEPLKFEIIDSVMACCMDFSQKEIFELSASSGNLPENEEVEESQTDVTAEKNKKLLLELVKNFKTCFFGEQPAVSATHLKDPKIIRARHLPKYRLKDFSKVNDEAWKNTVNNFLTENSKAIDCLPIWFHPWRFRSKMEELSHKLTPETREEQAIAAFYYLQYKGNDLHARKIDALIYNYAINKECEMFGLFKTVRKYMSEKKLMSKPIYVKYLKEMLSSSNQINMNFENCKLELNVAVTIIEKKDKKIKELTLELENSKNTEILKEIIELRPALRLAKEEMQKAKSEIENLKNDMNLLQIDIKEMTEEKNELQQKCDTLTKVNNELQQKCDTVTKENDEIKIQKGQLEIKLQETELRASTLEKEVIYLKSLLNDPKKKSSSIPIVKFNEKENTRISSQYPTVQSFSVEENHLNNAVPLKRGYKIFDPKSTTLQPENQTVILSNGLTTKEEKCVIF